MRKVVALLLVVVFVLAFSSVAFAVSPNAQEGFESYPTFETTDRGDNHFTNANNDEVRFRLGGATAVPGKAHENASDNSVIGTSFTGGTLIQN